MALHDIAWQLFDKNGINAGLCQEGSAAVVEETVQL